MKILYVTRHFNHSGYIILEKMINEGIHIEAVLLHKIKNKWRSRFYRPFLLLGYKFKCAYYRCKPLKTVASIEFLAHQHHIPIIYTDSIKSDAFYNELQKIDPDIIVLGGGWHELIPERVYTYPKLGCINTHPSLLPEFRGTSITRWQILYGLKRSGSTIHYVDDRFDTGEILTQKDVSIQDDLTPQELFLKLSHVGAELIIMLLHAFETTGTQSTIKVEHNEHNKNYYNYYSKWEWSELKLKIDWTKNLRNIHFFVLANTQESYEYLGPHFIYRNKKYILRKTRIHNKQEFNNYLDNKLNNEMFVLAVQKGSLFIFRKEEEHVLELIQLQRFDNMYKFRRSHPAAKLIRIKKNNIFKPE